MLLTNTLCRNAKYASGKTKLVDGGGLYLHLSPSGTKIWRQRYRFNGKENTLTHGPYPLLSLLEARDKREEARKLLLAGIDPAQVKKDHKLAASINAATTFELVAREWHDLNKDNWAPIYATDMLHRLGRDVFPFIGNRPIADITAPHLLDVMRKIERRGAHEVARRTLRTCGQIFQYAIITGRMARNPATDLRGALKPARREHYAALESKELPEFLRVLEINDARLFVQTRHAIRMLMLTFVRTSELIGSKWSEYDFANAEWIIPAERMKMRKPHIVPLCKQVLAILREMRELNGNRDYVFASQAQPRKHMSNNTILFALKRLGYQGRMTGHGFRALAMTTIKEKLGYRHEVVDRQLAHAPANKVDAAYDRAKFLDDRRVMMQEWADYLDKIALTGTVVHVDFAQTAS
jgi:integrase